ncbi:MAG TPA: hypothetical protein DEH22_07180, partial [Chloroflexi bacterium]|nr:hypothetical protein [Chloroflexota bacterium]
MQRPFFTVLSVFILIAILLTACGGTATVAPPQIQATEAPKATEAPMAAEPTQVPQEDTPVTVMGIQLPVINPADYPGDVVSAGSSTVFPLAEVI